jgi:hypothetical protein
MISDVLFESLQQIDSYRSGGFYKECEPMLDRPVQHMTAVQRVFDTSCPMYADVREKAVLAEFGAPRPKPP